MSERIGLMPRVAAVLVGITEPQTWKLREALAKLYTYCAVGEEYRNADSTIPKDDGDIYRQMKLALHSKLWCLTHQATMLTGKWIAGGRRQEDSSSNTEKCTENGTTDITKQFHQIQTCSISRANTNLPREKQDWQINS